MLHHTYILMVITEPYFESSPSIITKSARKWVFALPAYWVRYKHLKVLNLKFYVIFPLEKQISFILCQNLSKGL